MRALVIVILLSCLNTSLYSQKTSRKDKDSPFFQGKYEQFMRRAQLASKAYALFFFKEGDELSTKMIRESWQDPKLKGFIHQGYQVYALSDKSLEGKKLLTEYQIRTLPAILVFHPHGQLLRTTVGFASPGEIQHLLEGAYKALGESVVSVPPQVLGGRTSLEFNFQVGTEIYDRKTGNKAKTHQTISNPESKRSPLQKVPLESPWLAQPDYLASEPQPQARFQPQLGSTSQYTTQYQKNTAVYRRSQAAYQSHLTPYLSRWDYARSGRSKVISLGGSNVNWYGVEGFLHYDPSQMSRQELAGYGLVVGEYMNLRDLEIAVEHVENEWPYAVFVYKELPSGYRPVYKIIAGVFPDANTAIRYGQNFSEDSRAPYQLIELRQFQ